MHVETGNTYEHVYISNIIVWVVRLILFCAASQQMGFGNALKTYPASVIEFGISGLGAIAVSGLACMHTWLIATMQTTNEDVRY